MRHILGVLGVLAAGVLLAVSAAMNWRFGYNLGKTEFDGLIYGSASAAADCFKALVPFFFFAAWKNRMWSQAVASAVVWVVVTAYSLTSALGHAALNRQDTTGQRAADAQSYKDFRADLKRAQDQLSWVPQHRPAATVQSDVDGVKNQRAWTNTRNCTEVSGRFNREFCQQFATLMAELASAQEAAKLEARIAEVQAKLGRSAGGTVLAEADPQAAVLAKLAAIVLPSVKVDDVQMALTLFIALLLEIGSGFGMYVAFSTWRLYDVAAPVVPAIVALAAPVVQPTPAAAAKRRTSANDNRSAPPSRHMAPEDDVARFYKEKVESKDGSAISATELYERYCAWCEELQKEPLALPTFGRDFSEFGIKKIKRRDGVQYVGIELKAAAGVKEDKKSTVLGREAA